MIRLNLGLKRAYRNVFKRYGISTPVVVHTMAHVGTTTISHGLGALNLGVPVYHAHTLNNLEKSEAGARKHLTQTNAHMDMLRDARNIRNQYDNWRGRPWNFISLVRDPVARNLSSFFYEIEQFVPDFHDRVSRGELGVEQARDMFFEIGGRVGRWGDSSSWFDEQVRDFHGIDVYATNFPKEAGYAIYEGRRARLLLLRLESLEHCTEEAFRTFLGIPNFRPAPANSAELRQNGAFYNTFKGARVLPESYLDSIYGSRLARHFYTDEELQRFKRRWLR